MKDFKLGCNYWASHAGIEMWKQWDAEQVEKDLTVLEANGVKTMRVFPLWRDFQPVMPLYAQGGIFNEYMLEGCIEPTNRWYLDETMMERFAEFCDICQRHGMQLIVGLITGWMSGRLFIPSVLYGKNLYTDPTAVMLEQKFVRGFVSAFKDREVIYAWDLGNECNCMSPAQTREETYVWSATISNAIKAVDPTRPIVSGMHSLTIDAEWRIEDQGETTDILTTHPYAYFVPHCLNDPIDSYRTLLHGTCESALYAAVGGKPCMIEELGTLSHNMCNDETSADFMRASLYSGWANGATGVLWWCAHDQTKLTTPPYSWNMLERELGMLDTDMNPKPYLTEMKKFGEWLKTIDFEIEEPKKDGIILLSKGQDHWGIAYMTYLLGKQAGATLDFLAPNKDIPDAKVYFLPSATGQSVLYTKYYEQLKEKVRNGATLYVSNDDGFFSQLKELFGISVTSRELVSVDGEMTLDGSTVPYHIERKMTVKAEGAEVICANEAGEPLLTLNRYGKGKVYHLCFPLEKMLLPLNRAFEGDTYKIYEKVLAETLAAKNVVKAHPKAGITENGNIVTVVNYSNEPIDPKITVRNSKKIGRIYHGSIDEIPTCDAVVFSIE